MTPYFEESGITIYHGDCRDVLPCLSADALITDPPYGVELGSSDSRGKGHGLIHAEYASYDDTMENWLRTVPPVISASLQVCKRGAIFAGKYPTYLPPPAVIGGVYCSAAVGRNPWGFTNLMAVFFYGKNPQLFNLGAVHTVLRSNESAERNGHPCPKPYGWMAWLCSIATQPHETVLDPFMGSGTTLVAAKRLGCKAIGIEIEERYCEIAAERLRQGTLDLFSEAASA